MTSPVRAVPSGARQAATTVERPDPSSGSPANRRASGAGPTTTAVTARRSSCWTRTSRWSEASASAPPAQPAAGAPSARSASVPSVTHAS
ncbi:hypothetical protein AB0387_25305 [Streptomyces sp. NPDC089173]|uniref:hypothetical protein n=1 Tax=Streptomyces sp. NPDC089173 TaxID=3154965 RepID=UPI00344F858C